MQAALGPATRVAWSSGRLVLWAGAELLAALPQRVLVVRDLGVERALGRVSPRAWLGVEVRFGDPREPSRPGT
jgi:hypothetical protein